MFGDRFRAQGLNLSVPPRSQGIAVIIPPEVHYNTRTYGGNIRIALASDQGATYRDVLARDIADLRTNFGRGQRYNPIYRELLSLYYAQYGHLMEKK